MISPSQTTSPQFSPRSLSPSLKHGLRALTIAGDEFEPFVDWIINSSVIEELIASGLAEQGRSSRPSVGPVGFRLTNLGKEAIETLWSSSPRRMQLVP